MNDSCLFTIQQLETFVASACGMRFVGKIGPEEGLLSDGKIVAHLKKHKAFGPKKI